jgi:hypothetical protein
VRFIRMYGRYDAWDGARMMLATLDGLGVGMMMSPQVVVYHAICTYRWSTFWFG